MYKAVKVRIYPDVVQQDLLRRHIGCSRAIYNFGLRWAQWNYYEALEQGEKPKGVSHFTFTAWLTEFKKNEEVSWLNEVPVNVLSMSLERLARAYTNFFKRRNQGVGFPKIKGKHARKTARYSRTVHIAPDGRAVSLPPRAVGWIPMRGWRADLCGTVKTCTVEFAPSGRWYLSIMMDDGVAAATPAPKIDERVVAVHCGLKDHITLFDGSTTIQVDNPKVLSEHMENLRRKARTLSRKAEAARGTGVYSRRREKARIQLARVHERVANGRADHLNKLAHQIARMGDVVILETWRVKRMLEADSGFSRDIADAGWSMLFTKIESKVAEFGGRVIRLEKYFPSSQICSACGETSEEKVPLSAVEWTCKHCGAILNRNTNAAKNVYACGRAL